MKDYIRWKLLLSTKRKGGKKGKSLLVKQMFKIPWIILDVMANNNSLNFNDIHSEINYDFKLYDLLSNKLVGKNELDT